MCPVYGAFANPNPGTQTQPKSQVCPACPSANCPGTWARGGDVGQETHRSCFRVPRSLRALRRRYPSRLHPPPSNQSPSESNPPWGRWAHGQQPGGSAGSFRISFERIIIRKDLTFGHRGELSLRAPRLPPPRRAGSRGSRLRVPAPSALPCPSHG